MKCHVCKSGYNRREQPNYIYDCPQCGHTYRRFDGDPVEFHTKTYRKNKGQWRNQKEFNADGSLNAPVFHEKRKVIVENRLKLMSKYLDKNDMVLDIGSGGGTFGMHIQPLVKVVHCNELDLTLAGECEDNGMWCFIVDWLKLELDWGYDVITSWHALEHCEDIKGFVRKCTSLARKYVILEVPKNRGLPEKFDGHLHHFSDKSFRKLVEDSGLEIIEFGDGVQKPSIFVVAKVKK